MSRVGRTLRRWWASNDELESEDLQRVAHTAGATPIAQAQDREQVTLRGMISVLTLKPRNQTPWLEAEFTDGSGTVTLIWMGRRQIAGISAGRTLTVSGRVSDVDGQRRLYNPRYELVA